MKEVTVSKLRGVARQSYNVGEKVSRAAPAATHPAEGESRSGALPDITEVHVRAGQRSKDMPTEGAGQVHVGRTKVGALEVHVEACENEFGHEHLMKSRTIRKSHNETVTTIPHGMAESTQEAAVDVCDLG